LIGSVNEIVFERSHPHLHGEYILNDFSELKMEKLNENHVHEAVQSRYHEIKQLGQNYIKIFCIRSSYNISESSSHAPRDSGVNILP